ncbi:hypothetical protein ACH4ND_01590 [Streptomyces sp. NPDC017179]|uniref:hypothetical protein n=1 Tax=Streptomyces sp. NPDC017179 TaxID=3364979 RepID=UPI0037AB90AE
MLGRRGAALALLGTGKMCFGLGYILTPHPDPRGLELLTRFAGIRYWAVLWVVCGAAAFGSAWLRIGRDRWGFIAALLPPFVWGAAFLWGSLAGDFPRGLAIFGWYATSHIGIILWAAAVPEYEMPHLARRERA